MSDKYILDANGEPVAAELMEWATWFENSHDERRVARDMVGDVKVSTVFLGLDHSFGNGPPLLFETMVFGGRSIRTANATRLAPKLLRVIPPCLPAFGRRSPLSMGGNKP